MKKPPDCANCARRTLWKAVLDVRGAKQEFYFRASEDFAEASAEAVKIVEGSTAADMSSAILKSIDRFARLWN